MRNGVILDNVANPLELKTLVSPTDVWHIDLWIDLLRMSDVCKNVIPDIFPDVCTEAYINLWAIGYVSLHIVSRVVWKTFLTMQFLVTPWRFEVSLELEAGGCIRASQHSNTLWQIRFARAMSLLGGCYFFWGSKSKSSLVRCPCGFRLRKLAEDVGTTLIMLKSLALPECGARFLSYYMSCLFKRFLQEDLEDVLSWRCLFESLCGR